MKMQNTNTRGQNENMAYQDRCFNLRDVAAFVDGQSVEEQ
jgi:hypothetical protein